MEKASLCEMFKNKDFGDIRFNEPMKNHTSFKIGGPADLLVIPNTEEQFIDVVTFVRSNNIKYFIMGNGTNLLVKDTGIRGVVIKTAKGLGKMKIEEDLLICQSGVLLSTSSKQALKNSLSGIEFASGIPGTIGGAITMNAGAYGGEMKDVVKKVRVLDKDNNILELSNDDMNFRYRASKVVDEGLIVLSVEIKLEKEEYSKIDEKMKELTHKRVSKQPLEYPSAGSTFKRPEGYYAGKLIDDSGLRGLRYGDAQVSEKHCGFVINVGQATFEHVSTLIDTVRKVVDDKFNVRLEREVKIIGDD